MCGTKNKHARSKRDIGYRAAVARRRPCLELVSKAEAVGLFNYPDGELKQYG